MAKIISYLLILTLKKTYVKFTIYSKYLSVENNFNHDTLGFEAYVK